MVKNKLFFSFAFILCFFVSGFGQNPQVASVVHTPYKINSQILNEERTILVRVPPNYQAGEKFPVVYMLDAHAPQNAMMAGIIEQQVWGGMMPEMIVVGIQNTNRTRDMTPTAVADRAGSGGGEKFLDFIEKEVIPLIEKNYRTQPFRIFAGHSLGGLTAVYAFATRPDLFNAYIAASPVLHWDNKFVVKRAEELFKRFGYEIFIPEELLNRAGYQIINAGKFVEAIEIFRKNAVNYPNSSNVYDSLGEAFEKNGQMKQAAENYAKAYNLAKAQSNEQLATIFKTNLDRVSEKLK